MMQFSRFGMLIAVLLVQFCASGCTPTVAIKAPEKPIVINMNIKIEHEIKMNVDRDLEAMIEEEKDIF